MLEVFVDFDGTITDVDTFDALVRAVAGDDAWNAIDDALIAGDITLREALVRQAALVRLTRAETFAFMAANTTVDPTFKPFVAAVRAHGGAIRVVSAGIATVIHEALERNGIDVDVLANEADFSPAGWTMTFRDATDNGHDKAVHVIEARAQTRIAHDIRRRRHQRFPRRTRSRRTLRQIRPRTRSPLPQRTHRVHVVHIIQRDRTRTFRLARHPVPHVTPSRMSPRAACHPERSRGATLSLAAPHEPSAQARGVEGRDRGCPSTTLGMELTRFRGRVIK